MPHVGGTYRQLTIGGEIVRAFIPHSLSPRSPVLRIEGELAREEVAAKAAVDRLEVASAIVPSTAWFLYGFVRKEAVISSQIEGIQATLPDVLRFEALQESDRIEDVEEVCNYVAALEYARAELAAPRGLPLCSRLLCEVHRRLMQGTRGADKLPGTVRTSQNWIGGTRPGNAIFVPPPPEEVPDALAALDRWIHEDRKFSPLVRAGLAHVQFETIHPFLDGNGRVGRMLISLMIEQSGLLNAPILYLSLAFKRHREEYYRRLSSVRTDGDWEGWVGFFLTCVKEAADDGVAAAGQLFQRLNQDRQRLTNHSSATVTALRLFERLSEHPIVTQALVMTLLETTKPTAHKTINTLVELGILKETTGKRRDRVYSYQGYLSLLSEDTELSLE